MSKYERTLKRFQKIVDDHGGANVIAFQLRVSPAFLSLILNSKRDLSDLNVAYRIETLFGIPMKDWAEDVDVETVQRVAR